MTPYIFSQNNPEGKIISLIILTGGHDFERDAFFTMFDSFKSMVYQEVTHPAANEIYLNGMAEKADVLIYYDMMQEITEEQKRAMVTLLKQGKPCLFLHHSLASYQDWPQFEQIIGGKYIISGNSITPASTYHHDVEFSVHIQDHNHPITRGIKDFVIHDEVYGGFRIQDTCLPLLTTNHAESNPVIAWLHKYGKSPIVTIQPGHDHYSYENKNYRKLIYNAIIWLTGKE